MIMARWAEVDYVWVADFGRSWPFQNDLTVTSVSGHLGPKKGDRVAIPS